MKFIPDIVAEIKLSSGADFNEVGRRVFVLDKFYLQRVRGLHSKHSGGGEYFTPKIGCFQRKYLGAFNNDNERENENEVR